MKDEEKEKFEQQLKKADDKLTDINKQLEKKLDKEELKALSDKLEGLQDSLTSIEQIKFGEKEVKTVDAITAIQDQINNLEVETKARLFDLGDKGKTLDDKLKDLVTSDEWKNHQGSLNFKSGGGKFVLEKAANDLLTSDWTADTGAVGLPQLQLPGVTKHPWRRIPIFSAVPKRTVGMEHQVSYTEELTRSDAAALKAEGSQYAQSGATWITRVLDWYDFGHYVKVTRESLEDAEYIRQEMNDLLQNGLLRVIEVLIYNGSGSSTVEGVYTAAKDFVKTLGVKSVSNPSMRDILMAAKLQCAKGYNASAANDTNKTGYIANLALIGMASAYNVTTEKDEIGRPLIEDINSWRPGGMAVTESEDVTESETTKNFVVGDFNKAMLYLKRNLTIETGYDGNDFTYGMITLRASLRGNLLIKNLEKYAFVKGDFETAKETLQS